MPFSPLRLALPFVGSAAVCGLQCIGPSILWATGDKIPAQLFVKDALVSPDQTAMIEAKLVREVRQKETPAAGEPLELVRDGNVVATATTDESGRSKFRYRPLRRGNSALTVRVAPTSQFSAAADTIVAAWERRTPLLVVEMAALVVPSSRVPVPDAADELNKLSQFYYNVIYVAESDNTVDPFKTSDRTRRWLREHKFPVGYALVLPSTVNALGVMLDELRSIGWIRLKVGVGISNEFAEAFLQRRLEAVILADPAKDNVPKKAKRAKDWKEVRKKL